MPLQPPLGQNLSNISGMFDQQRQQAETPPIKIKAESNERGGMDYTFKTDDQTAMNIMNKMTYLEQALSAMSQEKDRLQAQEQQARAHPLMNVLSQVAGQLAVSDKRLPPVVSALGRANLALNPTPDELAQRRLGLMDVMAQRGGQAAEMGMRLGQMDIARQKEAREQEREARLERTGMIGKLNEQAMRGELSDPALVEGILKDLPGMTPEKTKALAAELVGASQQRQAAIAAKEAALDTRQQRMLDEKAKESERHMQALFAGMAMRESMFERKLDAQKEAEERKKTGKEMEVPKTIPEKLAHLKSAESTLDQIEAGLNKYRKYQGIVAGRTVEPVAAYFKPDVAKFFNKIKLQVSQAIQSTGAGARGFGPWERGYFTSMTEAKTHSPEENLGIIQSWRDYLRAQRDSYLSAYKGLRKPDTGTVLGRDKDLLEQIGLAEEAAPKQADPLGIR